MLKHLLVAAFCLSLLVPGAAAQNASQINNVLKGKSCTGCNLFQAEMQYMGFERLTLAKSRLRQSNLALSTFDDTSFSGADLSVSNLFGARFNRCSFVGANMKSATGVGVFFGSSDFRNADLTNANLSGADLKLARNLTQAQLNKACGDRTTRLPKGKTIPACTS